MPRPELGPINPGDPVIVTDPDRPKATPVAAHVVKAARVWIDLQETNQVGSLARTWRMRRDTQNTGTGYGWGGCRFVTPEQHAWDQDVAAADRLLAEQGISVRAGSPWRDGDRLLQLAGLVRAVTPAAITESRGPR